MKKGTSLLILIMGLFVAAPAFASVGRTVPTDIQMPNINVVPLEISDEAQDIQVAQPLDIKEIQIDDRDQLDPQPEPPDEVDRLDPQPEPPLEISDKALDLQVEEPLDVREIKGDESVELNPQPEPPMDLTKVFSSTEDRNDSGTATFELPVFSNAPALKTEIKFEDDGAVMTMPMGFTENDQTMDLKIRPEFKITGSEISLTKDDKEYKVKTSPLFAYTKMRSALETEGITEIKKFSLDVEDGQAVYKFDYKEPVKLFGFIPVNVRKEAIISADKNSLVKVNNPWYSFLFADTVNIADTIELLPNLAMTSVRFEPANFSAGDQVKVIGTVKNEGPVYAAGGLNISTVQGPAAGMAVNGYTANWYYIFLYLKPGQSYDYEFTWKSVICGADVTVDVAAGSYIGETTKDDNVMTVKANCQ